MQVSVENWAYVLIKLARFRKNQFIPSDVEAFDKVSNVDEFLQEFQKIYPHLSLTSSNLTLINFEQVLWKDYFNAVNRLLNASSSAWQFLLSEYLLKYQIRNLKTIIMGKIADIDPDLLKSYINWEVEDILNNKKIVEMLLSQKTPRELLYTLRNSRYGSILREGLSHYFNDKDTFYFQAYLDKFYYTNLLSLNFNVSREESETFKRTINIEAEYHNVKMIYRSISNQFDPRIIYEMLVPSHFFVNQQQYTSLISARSTAAMSKMFVDLFRKHPEYSFIRDNPINTDFTYYIREFYAREQLHPIQLTDDLEIQTFDEIFHLLKSKEYAIYHLIRTLTRIFHHIQFGKGEISE